MRLRDFLPRAGWTMIAFAGLGAGATVALVTDVSGRSSSAEAATAASQRDLATAHCRVAAIPAQAQSPEAMKAYEDAEPPLWNDLGSLSYPISTKSAEAQSYFDQGLRFAVNFNHAEARRAFRKAQSLDPTCAMCFLGEALVLGPNINVPMDPEANAPAIAALRKAQALAAARARRRRD